MASGGGEYDPLADAPRRPSTALAMAANAGGRGYGGSGGYAAPYGAAEAPLGAGGAGRGYRPMQQPGAQQQMQQQQPAMQGGRYAGAGAASFAQQQHQQPMGGRAGGVGGARYSPAAAAMPSPVVGAGFGGPPVDVRYAQQAPTADVYGAAASAPAAGHYGRPARGKFTNSGRVPVGQGLMVRCCC